MAIFLEVLIALLAAFGLVCLGWLAFGKMVLPVGGKTTHILAIVSAAGDGGGLEQAVSGLLWLRRTGLWRGRVVIEDKGLGPEGLALARRLTEYPGVELRVCPGKEEIPPGS